MIVVGIIGILVSIAAPQFNKYQRKARQAEAKIALAAIFSLEKGFYSEYSAYAPSFDAIGYTPEGQRRFYYTQITADANGYTGTITGYSGSLATPWYSNHNSPFPWGGSLGSPFTCDQTFTGAAYGNDPQAFYAWAMGNLYPPGVIDGWQINHLKVLSNCSVGL